MQSTEPEVWKPIPGTSGWHEASSLGRIRSVTRVIEDGRTFKGRVKKLGTSATGHLRVNLSYPGFSGVLWVHRLIAAAFIGPCPEGMEVRHLNDVPSDNRAENLVYGTRKENVNDRDVNGINHFRNRTHCPYGHPHEPWNCVASEARKGHRSCLACARARAYAHKHGTAFSKDVADKKVRILESENRSI